MPAVDDSTSAQTTKQPSLQEQLAREVEVKISRYSPRVRAKVKRLAASRGISLGAALRLVVGGG
jgi:hypothetical protein